MVILCVNCEFCRTYRTTFQPQNMYRCMHTPGSAYNRVVMHSRDICCNMLVDKQYLFVAKCNSAPKADSRSLASDQGLRTQIRTFDRSKRHLRARSCQHRLLSAHVLHDCERMMPGHSWVEVANHMNSSEFAKHQVTHRLPGGRAPHQRTQQQPPHHTAIQDDTPPG
jgi:hypothetical protein